MADRRDLILRVTGKDDGASRVLKNVGEAAGKSTDDLDAFREGFAAIDKQIIDTKGNIEALRKEIGKSGDIALFRDLEKETRKLKALTKRRDLLGDFGELGRDNAEGFSASFSQRIGPLLLKAPIGVPLAAAAAAGAPAIASAVSGAVTLGLAAAVVAGGITIAAKDPLVKTAARRLGDTVSEGLVEAAEPFVPETLKAIAIVRKEFISLKPELRGLFADSARFVQPLTRAATGFVRELVPGLRDAARNAQPVVDLAEEHLPRLGRIGGQVFRDMGSAARDSKDTLDGLITAIEGGVLVTSKVTSGLAKIGPFIGTGPLAALGKALGGTEEDAGSLSRELQELLNRLGNTSHVSDVLRERQILLGSSFHDAIREAEGLAGALDKLNGKAISAEQAEIGYQSAIDAVTESLKTNGKTVDVDSAKGRANREVLLSLARAGQERAAAVYESTLATKGTVAAEAAASRANEEGRQQLIRSAMRLGLSKKAAIEYANSIYAIPKNWTTNFAANTKPAMKELRDLRAYIRNFPKYVSVTVDGNVKVRGGGQILRGATGGPVEGPGPKGVDSVQLLAAPGEHILTSREVDRMGGQAAVSQFRKDLMRGMTPAASRPMPARASASPQRIDLRVSWDGPPGMSGDLGQALIRYLRYQIHINGGSAQNYLGQRGR